MATTVRSGELSAAELIAEITQLNDANRRGIFLLETLTKGRPTSWEEPQAPSTRSDARSAVDSDGTLEEQMLDEVDVDAMWSDFSVDQYVPPSVRMKKPLRKKWTPETTVPDPFTFDGRKPSKSRTLLEYEDEINRRQEREDAECRVRVRPTPVPATTHLSLFQKLVTQSKRGRESNPDDTAKGIDHVQKPRRGKPKTKSPDEQRATEELHRRSRAERAQQLLAEAQAPANLDKRGLRRQAEPERYPFRPKINDRVPDYDKLAAEFENKLAGVRARRPTTQPHPFRFRSEQLPSSKGSVLLDARLDDATLPETRWPFTMGRAPLPRHPRGPQAKAYLALSEAAQVREPQTTRAAEVRAAAVRKRQQEHSAQREREAFRREQWRERGTRLQPAVVATCRANDTSKKNRELRQRAVREKTAVERALELQYEAELALIKDRVERRPLLAQNT